MQNPTSSGTGAIRLRPEQPDDLDFLFALYATTRDRELSGTGWDARARNAFLRMQFTAQHTHYTTNYPHATFDVVELRGRPVGRLYVDRQSYEIRIIDIAMLPEFRGRGIGSAVLRAVLEQPAAAERPVTLHVEIGNHARRLYERLGFEEVSRDQLNAFMRREPHHYEKTA
jgi:ribosomal protein S18 acetylase RimI-like enzyme